MKFLLPERVDYAMKESGMSTNKPEFNGDASLLVDVELLGPLAEFPFATEPISDHLHALGHEWYVLVGSREALGDDLPQGTIRACMVVWASDLAGAMVATRCDDSVGPTGAPPPSPLPPVETFISSPGWSYGELVKAGGGKVMEIGLYGSDGVFAFKELRFPKVSVYFKSRGRKRAELPFAISIVGRKRSPAA
jgi:hypothetical protein